MAFGGLERKLLIALMGASMLFSCSKEKESSNPIKPADPIPIQENRAPIMNFSPILNVYENGLLSDQVRATDPDGDAITYSKTQGPSWFSVSSSGSISATPPEVLSD